jgi:ADP-ribose pyrophosphatase
MNWQSLSQRVVYDDRWMRLEMEDVLLPNGKQIEYLLAFPREFVIIVPCLTSDTVLMVQHYKHGAQENVLAFPAGYMEDGEAPEQAAKRELKEEVGANIIDLQHVTSCWQNPSRCRTRYHIFIADIEPPEKTHTNPDAQEGDVKIHQISIDTLRESAFLQSLHDGYMLSAIPFTLDHFELMQNKRVQP